MISGKVQILAELTRDGETRLIQIEYTLDDHSEVEVEDRVLFAETRPSEENNWSPVIHSVDTGRRDFTLKIRNGLLQ